VLCFLIRILFAGKPFFLVKKSHLKHIAFEETLMFLVSSAIQSPSNPQIRTTYDCSEIARLEVIREKIISRAKKGLRHLCDDSFSFSSSSPLSCFCCLYRRVVFVNFDPLLDFPRLFHWQYLTKCNIVNYEYSEL